MEKYYIIDSHGSSLFLQPYPKDFCVHCLVLLLDARPQEPFKLLSDTFVIGLSQLTEYSALRLSGKMKLRGSVFAPEFET